MQLPIQVIIRDTPQSQALINHIQQKAEKLDRFFDRIMSCRIAVEVPQKHKHNGKLYTVRIDLTVPHEELVINKAKNQDIYVAIRDAFNAARRKLLSYARRLRGHVKNHAPLTHGVVARLFPAEDYGFIASFDGREFYFHRANVAYPVFEHLEIGTEVQFLEDIADEGLQAKRVSTGKHQPLASD